MTQQTPNPWRSATVLKNQTHTAICFEANGAVVGNVTLTNADMLLLARVIQDVKPGGEMRITFVKDEPRKAV